MIELRTIKKEKNLDYKDIFVDEIDTETQRQLLLGAEMFVMNPARPNRNRRVYATNTIEGVVINDRITNNH